MELNSVIPSILPGNQETVDEAKSTNKTIKWDKEISFEEAYKALENAFYSFKEVKCTNSPDKSLVTGSLKLTNNQLRNLVNK